MALTRIEDMPPAYVEQAQSYEQRTAVFQGWRELLVDALPLRRGDLVLDVGCGTGLCFPAVQARVGPTGAVVGVDESAEMLALARGHVAEHGWRNVTLVHGPAETAALPGPPADAVLFCAVHDVVQSPTALRNVFDHVRPGAWVGAAGGKWPAPWLAPLSAVVAAVHAPFVRDFAGFDRPWRLLAEYVEDLRVTEAGLGTGYVAVGRFPG